MNINYKTIVPLKYLKDNILGNIPVMESDFPFFQEHGQVFTKYWKDNCKNFNNQILLTSKSFQLASEKSETKLAELFLDIINNDKESIVIQGTYIVNSLVFMINHVAIKESDDYYLYFYVFDKKGTPLMCHINDPLKNIEFIWISNGYKLPFEEKIIREFISIHVGKIIVIDMFKNFASVETSILDSKKKTKIFNCKYFNKTDSKIIYLNSNWFTNIVQSQSFSVRGHFRLQPKKFNGNWTRELIWVDTFEKKGYNLKAKSA